MLVIMWFTGTIVFSLCLAVPYRVRYRKYSTINASSESFSILCDSHIVYESERFESHSIRSYDATIDADESCLFIVWMKSK